MARRLLKWGVKAKADVRGERSAKVRSERLTRR